MNLLAANATSYIVLGVLVVLLVVYFVWSSKSMKKREENRQKTLDESMKVGAEIMTIGGLIGTIVEVSEDGESFVIETGTDDKKSYIKMAKVAFHSLVVTETDDDEADKTEDKAEEKTAEAPAEETEAKEAKKD